MSPAIGRRRYLTNFEVHRLPHLFTDTIVIGAGVAGLRAALAAAERGEVLLLTKGDVEDSCTHWAQGGIAAAVAADDSPDLHAEDTLACACGLADEAIVDRIVSEAPAQIRLLQEWGAQFDRDGADLALGREGAHQARRIIHAHGDATGREIVRVLAEQVGKHPKIRFFKRCFAIDIVTHESRAVGVITHHEKFGHQMFWAHTTILASGGVGRLYRETTNPKVATGDGLAMALRAGATLRDAEMIQFHPTTLYVAGAARALVSEAVRGEGAYLRNRAGERFMERYSELGELAPRDIVSRAITSEMHREHYPHVYLDVRHFEAGRFAQRFPTIFELCREFDIDPEKELIPVRPSAHYTVGGIVVDGDGRTDVPGLMACGEIASTGLHGANRLASNSLLEGLVCGRITGDLAGQRAAENGQIEQPLPVAHNLPHSPRTQLDLNDILHSLRSMMSRNVAVERSGDRLRETIEIIEFWSRYVMDKVFDEPAAWETQNLLTVGLCVTLSAATRCESRGVHYRTDFPRLDDQHWRQHIDLRRSEDVVRVATTPLGTMLA